MPNNDEADARRIREMLERHDTGSWNTDELARRIYELDKENLRTASTLDKRVSLIEKVLDGLPAVISKLVTETRFRPVELVVYGLIGGVGLTALGAVLAKIIR